MQGYWDALRVQATPGAPPWLCVQTPSNPGPLPKGSISAACQLGLDGAVCRSLAYERLMRRCKVWRALQIVWLDRLVGRGWHAQSPQNDVSCPVRSILPARGAEELWLSSSSSTPLVDVFIFLLWSRRKKCVVGPMTRDTSFGARAPKERLQPGTLKHQPCVMLSERT